MAEFKGGPVSVGAVSATNLSTLLSLPPYPKTRFSGGTIRASRSNSADVWVGKGNVTGGANQLGFIGPGEALTISEEYLNSDDVYFIAASGTQTLYVLLVVR